jgi:hypothetical protein
MAVAPLSPTSIHARDAMPQTAGRQNFADLVQNSRRADKPAPQRLAPSPRKLPTWTKEKNLEVLMGRNKRRTAQVAQIRKLIRSQPNSELLKALVPLCNAYKDHAEAIDIMERQEDPTHSNREIDYKHNLKFADKRAALNNSFFDAVDRAISKYPNSSFVPELRKIAYS